MAEEMSYPQMMAWCFMMEIEACSLVTYQHLWVRGIEDETHLMGDEPRRTTRCAAIMGVPR